MTLYLVRHGRPLVVPEVPAAEWELDPSGYDAVWALRESGRLPVRAAWFTSPEPKAVQTAQLLTEGEVGVVEGLREQVRAASGWVDGGPDAFTAVLGRAFADPDRPAYDGWEPLASCRERVVGTVAVLLAEHGQGEDVVLVGHGTAWTLVAAELTGTSPDLARLHALRAPDLIVVEPN